MKMQVECTNCKIELEIRENSLLFSEKKVIEKANCPSCETQVYSGETDGWFFVQRLKVINKREIEALKVIFPMP